MRRHDRDRFQTALFVPARRRESLFALYAFNYEVARVHETVSEPVLGQIRLQWWRESIAAAFDGGPVRHHIVVEALTAVIRTCALTRAHFDRLVDAREGDLADATWPSLAALENYAEATSARLVYLALEILGACEPAAEKAAFHVGIAYALTGLLRAIPFRARTTRLMIPADIAEQTGLDETDYQAQRITPALRAAVAAIAAAASRHLAAARVHRRSTPRSALPALLPGIIAGRSLWRLKRAAYDPFDPALASPDAVQSWWLAIASLRGRY